MEPINSSHVAGLLILRQFNHRKDQHLSIKSLGMANSLFRLETTLRDHGKMRVSMDLFLLEVEFGIRELSTY